MSTGAAATIDYELINVHALGKFEFCKRAGVIAIESSQSDEEDDWERTPRLDYLPLFAVALLDERLKESTSELKQARWPLLATALVTLLIGRFISFTFAMFLIPVVLVLGRKTLLHFHDMREVYRMLRAKRNATESHLEDPNAGVRHIDWWNLMKAEEFSSVVPRGRKVSETLKLTGKPAGIATYRGKRIPVVLHHRELGKAKPYHLVRLAAYAMLIEEDLKDVGANQKDIEVPWGIILNPRTMTGLAVPITDEARSHTKKRLAEFRTELQQVQNGTDPIAPDARFCEECPYGRPQIGPEGMVRKMLDGVKLPGSANRPKNANRYHSPCGDRFKWVPPHQRAIELRLRNG